MFFLGQCLRNVFEYISLIDHQLNIFNVHFLVSNILKPESLLVKKFKVIVLLDAFLKLYQVLRLVWSQQFHWQTLYINRPKQTQKHGWL